MCCIPSPQEQSGWWHHVEQVAKTKRYWQDSRRAQPQRRALHPKWCLQKQPLLSGCREYSTAAVHLESVFAGHWPEQQLPFPFQKQTATPLEKLCCPPVGAASSAAFASSPACRGSASPRKSVLQVCHCPACGTQSTQARVSFSSLSACKAWISFTPSK